MIDTISDVQQARHQAHAYLDRLSPLQINAVRGLLESMLSPLDRKLALAPPDDEPVTAEEAAALQAGINSLEHHGGVPLETVLADFGLTTDDFRRMADNAPEHESKQ